MELSPLVYNIKRMKFIAALGLVQALDVNAYGFNPLAMSKLYEATAADEELLAIPGPVYEPWMSEQEHDGYIRNPTAMFSADTDDIFMRSVIMTYAQEHTECDEDADGNPVNCKPNGVFTLNKSSAKALMTEVLGTHAGLSGDALTNYLNTYFDKAWGHFDVMQTGSIAAAKAGALSRFLLSDQRIQLGEAQ